MGPIVLSAKHALECGDLAPLLSGSRLAGEAAFCRYTAQKALQTLSMQDIASQPSY